jgi:hypothetical protein
MGIKMSPVPTNSKIYHITHVNNLEGIAKNGVLWSDTKRLELGLNCEIVGMSAIKRRRLEVLNVDCHPGTKVGQYVPFYFCPRSIMLYILSQSNHADITYRGGQRPIIHFQADLTRVVQWAEQNNIRWAFSDRNAGAYFAEFYKDLKDLDQINWQAVEATNWRDIIIREGKQAEFLVYESFPWPLVEKIGVLDGVMARQVETALSKMEHKPLVTVEKSWYY